MCFLSGNFKLHLSQNDNYCIELLHVASDSGRKSHTVAVNAYNLTVNVPQSSERPLIEREILARFLLVICVSFSALMLSVGQQEGHLTCKKLHYYSNVRSFSFGDLE